MIELFYNYDAWINDDGAIFDVVMTVAMICSVIVLLACISTVSGSGK